MSSTTLRILVLVVILGAKMARASEPRDVMKMEDLHVELTLGYGASVKFQAGGGSHEVAVVSPRLGIFFCDALDVGGKLEGVPELVFQLNYFQQFSPRDRVLLGICPLWRYDFFASSRVVPYVDVGAGLAYCDFGRPDEGGNWGFQLQVGVGCQIFVSDSVALVLECRFHHFSNAGIFDPNIGVNEVIGALGISFFY